MLTRIARASPLILAAACATSPIGQKVDQKIEQESPQKAGQKVEPDDADPTKEIEAELRRRYGEVGPLRYFSGRTDLNADGASEVVVHVVSPMLCGTGGCNTLVFTPRPDGYEVVGDISVSRPPVQVSSRSSEGWRNLMVRVSGGGISPPYDAELRFDGQAYPSNPTVAPAAKATNADGATTVIEAFGRADEGKLLPVTDTSPVTADALVSGTRFHATGKIDCRVDGVEGRCPFGVIRTGEGSATVVVTKPDGSELSIAFKKGKVIGYDPIGPDGGAFTTKRRGDETILEIGAERYEIFDAIVFGG